MTLVISELHLESRPEFKDYAYKKSNKLFRYHPKITDIKVRLIVEKAHRSEDHDYYCELTVHVTGKILEIVDSERDMYKAIDKAVERMKRALVKHHEKEISKLHKQGVVGKFLRRLKRS